MNASTAESAAERTGDAFRALRRGLARSDGFAIYVCTCNSRMLRDDLIKNLVASVTTPVHRLDVGTENGDLLDAIVGSVPDDGGPVMLVGLEDRLERPERAARLVERLNLRREEWPERLRRPVVFWVPSRMLGRLTGGAPDFFDWRSDTIDFPERGVASVVLGGRRWEYGVDPRFSKEEQNERRRELEARIRVAQDISDPRGLATLATWWDELAEIQFTQGDLDEALRIRREEQLPVYERLGDVHSRAVTLHRIASALLEGDDPSRERFREALDTLADAFATVGKLDDPQGIAVVGLAFARALVTDGRYDDAADVLSDAEAALERIGDTDSQAAVAALGCEIERRRDGR